MRYLLFLAPFLFVACEMAEPNSGEAVGSDGRSDSTSKQIEHEGAILKQNLVKTDEEKPTDTLEQRLIDLGLVDVQSLDPAILVDLKYTTTNNFLETDLYGGLEKAYIQPEVGEMLLKAQAALKAEHPEYTLLVFDAVRPVSVQWKMWRSMSHLPVAERTKYVSNPANGSVHNYGAAIDLTVADENGAPLDMGAGYDDFREIAYPRLEKRFLKSGKLTMEQYNNRLILRKAMKSAGFRQLATEWWHYNAFPRDLAKKKYPRVD